MTQTRALGYLEKCIVPPYICNVVVPTSLTLKHPVDEDLLKEAVLTFIKCQPNINAGVRKCDKDGLAFCPLEEIKDYFEVLPASTHWKSVCLKYGKGLLRQDCEHFCPLKVFLIPVSVTKAYLIPVYAHYCADGTNGMTMVNDILQNYQQLRRGVPLEGLPFSAPPSVEDMSKSAMPTVAEETEDLRKQYIRNFEDDYGQFHCSVPFEEGAIPASEALYYTSTPGVYEMFIEMCRSHEVTVGSALMTAMSFGLAGYIFEFMKDCPGQLPIVLNIPINLRERTPSDIPTNCCNLSVTQYLLSVGLTKERRFWELAKDVRMKLVDTISGKFHLFDFSNIREIETSLEATKKEVGVKYHGCVSNMRRFPGPVKYDEFNIESIHCVGGLWLTDKDVMELMIYSTDKLNLSMVHRAGEENARRADIVFKHVRYVVENCQQIGADFDLWKCMKSYKSIQ